MERFVGNFVFESGEVCFEFSVVSSFSSFDRSRCPRFFHAGRFVVSSTVSACKISNDSEALVSLRSRHRFPSRGAAWCGAARRGESVS